MPGGAFARQSIQTRDRPGLLLASDYGGLELGPAGSGGLIHSCQPLPAAQVNSPFNQSAVTHIHAAATSNFSRANFFRPPSLLLDQPSRKHPHRLFRSSTSRVNSQDGYVRLNFFQAFVCKWTIGNGLCEYEGAANSPPTEEFWIERAEVVTDFLPASAAAYLSEHT